MRGLREQRIEAMADHGAAATLGAAVAFALTQYFGGQVGEAQMAVAAVASAALTYAFAAIALRRVDPVDATLAVRSFSVASLDFPENDELLLTEQVELLLTERVTPVDELLLDDVVAAVSDHSRVVRLFDPARFRTPGELNSRIAAHLQAPRPKAGADGRSDASEALHQALSELRRSLR